MIWKELNDNLVFHNLKASDNIEVLQLMGDAMIQEGYGEEGFTEAILKREKDYPTGLDVNGIGVAIPHTDAEHVKKEGISIAVLNPPIEFFIWYNLNSEQRRPTREEKVWKNRNIF